MSEEPAERGHERVMSVGGAFLLMICAILGVERLPATASIGASAISWWLITLVLFFLPYGLITAELGSTYPDEGGIYVWIGSGRGSRLAASRSAEWWRRRRLGDR